MMLLIQSIAIFSIPRIEYLVAYEDASWSSCFIIFLDRLFINNYIYNNIVNVRCLKKMKWFNG